MSESILDSGYVRDEHAPDPVISHGDPTPPGKVATLAAATAATTATVVTAGSRS